jgi:hypothetical protein
MAGNGKKVSDAEKRRIRDRKIAADREWVKGMVKNTKVSSTEKKRANDELQRAMAGEKVVVGKP